MRRNQIRSIAFALLLLTSVAVADLFQEWRPAVAQGSSRYFPETQHSIQGRFLEYWQFNGGLMQQGYPISDEMQEANHIDGKVYKVQYFERAEFEYHPENKPPYDVLLSLLGRMRYEQRYPATSPSEKANQSENSVYFPTTGKRVGGSFLLYWKRFGGLAQQGYPISNEITETSELDGNVYTVQYFERSIMGWHPGNTPPYDVLLSQLGKFRYDEQYGYLNNGYRTPQLIARLIQGKPVSSADLIFYR